MEKITVKICDTIMGGGKTQAAISYMNAPENRDKNFLYITPFLTEVERIVKACPARRFVQPSSHDGPDGKKGSLKRLLARKRCIASTHQLLRQADQETTQLLKDGNYTLIMDETMSAVDLYPLHKDDVGVLIKSGMGELVNKQLFWKDAEYGGLVYRDLKRDLDNGCFIYVEDYTYIWNVSPYFLTACNEVIVLTYMFRSSILRGYLDILHAEYEYIGTKRVGDGEYVFAEPGWMPEYVKDLKNKIHIVEGVTNNIASNRNAKNAVNEPKKKFALSSSWYLKDTLSGGKGIKKLKGTISYLYNTLTIVPSKARMWTTFKEYQTKLEGGGYKKGFVACTARATNDFSDRTDLAYLVNIFMNPNIKKYFYSMGIEIDEDEYALSEMIQWIWRSAIRRGEDIRIYIPSERMRNLLKGWLDSF